MMKTVGIIGGMGPMAGVDLAKKIIEATPANTDQEHVHVILDNNTSIPDRTASIIGDGEAPTSEILNTALNLEKAGAECLIMGCNTAHYFLPRFKDKLHVPFFSIIEEAARYCHKKEVKCVALLATEGTLAAGIYDEAMSKYDIQLIKPDMDQRKVCQDIIYNGVKAGNKDYDTTAFCNVLKDLRAKGAEHFILGCTETPIAVEMYHIKESFIDPTDIIARRAVEFARTGK